jgi:hypothetical protein
MTKTLKIFGIAFGFLVLAGIALALVAPKHISIRSTQWVAGTKQQVFDHIRHLNNFPGWSPFLKADPQQKHWVTGNDGQVGATFHWVGVAEESEGKQVIVGLEGNSVIRVRCEITVPFEAQPTFVYTLTEKDGGVEVVQQFDNDMPVPANVFGMLFGLEAQMAATNQEGLALLKEALAKQPLVAVH